MYIFQYMDPATYPTISIQLSTDESLSKRIPNTLISIIFSQVAIVQTRCVEFIDKLKKLLSGTTISLKKFQFYFHIWITSYKISPSLSSRNWSFSQLYDKSKNMKNTIMFKLYFLLKLCQFNTSKMTARVNYTHQDHLNFVIIYGKGNNVIFRIS